MGFLFDPIFWGIVAFCVVMHLWNERDNKRYIRSLLLANDRMWNELLIKHQKAIADAFMEGKPFQIDIERT